jgi:hypothetical protein
MNLKNKIFIQKLFKFIAAFNKDVVLKFLIKHFTFLEEFVLNFNQSCLHLKTDTSAL